jgi:(1->4)-alpha-D-glucan 1-alpha-D-glucosylmutase
MAKGLEDTAFYVYNRLVSLNEVGGDPGRFGLSPEALHRYFAQRQKRWPWAMSATSTHDTKRSEDVRARINVLSEMPDAWREHVERWSRLNWPHRLEVEEQPAPDANEEYLLYQTLVGAWPLEPYSAEEYAGFVRRVQAYMVKALHEAKVHSSWINPNLAYDEAVTKFVERILDAEGNCAFHDEFRPFQRRVSQYGLYNSLAQVLLKLAGPGVPDTYQGQELWEFSLVDPDNRRPVDYERRARLLHELRGRVEGREDLRDLASELLASKEDGRIKLYATWRALRCRREQPELFTTGEYLPGEADGAKQQHVFGFARRQGDAFAVVAAPRLLTKLVPDGQAPLGEAVWQDTALVLPGVPPGRRWRNVFTGEVLTGGEREGKAIFAAGQLFERFPVALLMSER